MLTIDEFNEVCAFEYRALLEAEQEALYQEMLNAQLAEAQIMEYAANSYDLDAEAFGNQ
jgi:hypothetical protein|tara:strand:- start:485 stop:661 length:177 start_codon:yes stop_codon:yes gene_type:complete